MDASPLVDKWTKHHGLRIRYMLGCRRRRYIPDILVHYGDGRVYLEEVKGRIFRKREFLKKKWAAEVYCGALGWQYRLVFWNGLEDVS